MSPRAALRLETMDFSRVFDYKAGKADWLANGLPSEGTEADYLRAQDYVRSDVPTCSLTDEVEGIRDHVRETGWNQCIVIDETGVVLGRVRETDWDVDLGSTPIEEIMEPGPSTIRLDTSLADITERMHARNVEDVLVSSSNGKLAGVLFRSDADQALEKEGVANPAGR